MRIALNGRFYAAPITGVQRFAREVARRLPALADVVLMLPRGVGAPRLERSVEVVPGRLRGHAWEQAEFTYRAQAAGCDVCLSLGGTLPARGGPHVAALHDVLPLTHPQLFSRAFATWHRLVVRRNARRAAALITVSEWSAAQLAQVLPFPRERIHVAVQGVSPFDTPAAVADVERVRRKLRLPPRYVLGIGHGDPRKNAEFLVDVMREWRRRDADAPGLVLVGHALERVHGRHVPATDEFVCAVGRVDDDTLRALYTGAAAFAFPSQAEGYGRPPLEAVACGAPAIVAPYDAAKEVLGDGAAIVPLDVDAWIAELRVLTRPGSERDACIARGAAVARTRTWDATADQVLAACMAAAGTPAVVAEA